MDFAQRPPQYNRNVARRGANLVIGSKTPSAFSGPNDLANKVGWWDFSNSGTVTTGTGGIVTIADAFAGVINPTQGGSSQRPDVTTLNGIGAAHFVSNDYMQYNIADFAQPFTIWCVFKYDAAHAGNKTIFGDSVSGTQSCLFSETSTYKLSTFGGSVLSTGIATDTNPHLFIGVFNGASSAWRIDANTGTGTLSASTFATLNLGAWSTNADLVMGECGIVTGVMSAGESSGMRTYSQAKWGTA